MGWFNRLFARAPQDAETPSTQPAVENDVLPTVGPGPADADLGQAEPVVEETAPAVGESEGALTPTTEDRVESPGAEQVGIDAPPRGMGAGSGPVSTQAMTVPQLREQARALGLSGYSRMSKAELIEAIARAK